MKEKSYIAKSDRIFVAGARGMVGKAISKKLLTLGYGDPNKNGCLLNPNKEELNLLDLEKVCKWFEVAKPEIVIIAAAKVGGIVANNTYPFEFLIENLKIQNNIIETAFKFKVKRLLFLGSSCIYPKFAQQPIKEEYLLKGDLEKTNECYALAKIAGIKLCEALIKQYDFDAISLMPTNLYGPGDNYHPQNSHVLPGLIRRFHEAKMKNEEYVTCWGSGNPRREFLHVDDLAEASVFLLEKWKPNISSKSSFSWINVGTGNDVTIKELSEKIASVVGFEGIIKWDTNKPDGTPQKKLDVTRLKDLGWEAKINLDEGLYRTYEVFKKEFNNLNH
tara:strand:+ start:12093 stop:13091 length:999 start_codon:yes stop_codon:yes gene_type:complete